MVSSGSSPEESWALIQSSVTWALSLEHTQAGYLDFKDVAISSLGLSTRSLSYRISDHYPLWAEFRVPTR